MTKTPAPLASAIGAALSARCTPSLRKASFAAALALAIYATPAHAQLLTFVSATGGDMRPCTVQAQPCKTLQRAIDATTAGGEIRLLSSLPNQSADIDKSLTVDGAGHTMIGGINIDSATAVVTLRNLSLNGRALNAFGIVVGDAAAVHIENCIVERYVQDGIRSDAVAAELFVVDSVSRGNGQSGLAAVDGSEGNAAKLTVAHSRFENNNESGISIQDIEANITRSLISGNFNYGLVQNGGHSTITWTTAANNGSFGFYVEDSEMTLEHSVAHNNNPTPLGSSGGLIIHFGGTGRVSNSVFTNNQVGITNLNILQTGRNNLLAGNSNDLVNAGVIFDLEPM